MIYNDVHEVFSFLVARSASEPNLLKEYLRYFTRLMPIVRLARSVSPIVKACSQYDNRRFAIYSSRFNHVIEGLESNSLLLFGKPQELPYALKRGVSFYPVYDFIPDLFALYLSDPRLESGRAVKLIDHVTSIFAHMNPAYLVLWNDTMFLERFLVFCGRRAGVKSICIQHGIFHDTFDCRLLDGHYTDYMFVWGKSQADLYTKCGYDKDRLRIMGYPFRIENLTEGKKGNVICLLGENIEITNKEIGLKKKHVYEEIARLLQNNNYKVVYKPHPYEIDKNFIPENIEIVSFSLRHAFEKYDKFIALTSTALLEATLHGKIAVQYYDDIFGGCDFSLQGFSYTTRDLNELPLLLSRLSMPSVISTDALLLTQNPAQRFLDAVESLQ